MERDEFFLKEYDFLASQVSSIAPFLFFYSWDEVSLTIGKIQSNRDEIIAEAERRKIPVYERPTGGKAVLHGGDICYTFIAKQNHPEYGGKLLESYQKVNSLINNLVQGVLSKDSSEIQAYPSCDSAEKRKITDNCFDINTKGEGYIETPEGKVKIIGAAQQFYGSCFIQQGSIQLNRVDIDWPLFRRGKVLSEILGKELDLKNLELKLKSKAREAIEKPLQTA